MARTESDQLTILRSILDGLDALICVCDHETFDLIFLNDSIKEHFGITVNEIGYKCYKLLQGLDAPCPTCPYARLNDAPDETITWEHHEVVNGRILLKTAKLIDWPNGRKAHLEYAIDVTDMRKNQETIIQLESQVEKDSLTGIYNRRYFDEHLDRIISALSRSDGKISLLMIDIDFFKKYNDTYGHLKGDECLKAVANALKNTPKRKDDFVARYGGEEFVVVLPNATEEGTRLVAEMMLENIYDLNITHEGGCKNHVTISIGAAHSDAAQPLTATELINAADRMLYESKRTGRNKCSFINLNPSS